MLCISEFLFLLLRIVLGKMPSLLEMASSVKKLLRISILSGMIAPILARDHSFDMSNHLNSNLMNEPLVDPSRYPSSYSLSELSPLECNEDDDMREFKFLLLENNALAVKYAANIVQSLYENHSQVYTGIDSFFHDICDIDKKKSFCVYGLFNAIVLNMVTELEEQSKEIFNEKSVAVNDEVNYPRIQFNFDMTRDPERLEMLYKMAINVMGSLQCLDYLESTSWRYKSTDLLAIWQNSTYFAKRSGSFSEPVKIPRHLEKPDLSHKDVSKWILGFFSQHTYVGGDLFAGRRKTIGGDHLRGVAAGGMPGTKPYVGPLVGVPNAVGSNAMKGSSETPTSPSMTISMALFGTHPTLTLEPYTMLADFVFINKDIELDLLGVYGIAYKCHLYPILCNDEDPVALMLGAFDRPEDAYTFANTVHNMRIILEQMVSGAEVYLCTSPFFLCIVIASVIGPEKLLFSYMGLPSLWKAPVDVVNVVEGDGMMDYSSDTVMKFWALATAFFARDNNSVWTTNNPLLFEQLRWTFGADLTQEMRILRPHNRYMNVYYVPRENMKGIYKKIENHHEGTNYHKKGDELEKIKVNPRLRTAALNAEVPVQSIAVVSRTKFQWVTFECLLKRVINADNLPINFEILNTNSKKSFPELASYTSVVLIPWEAALFAFYEFYSMNMPLLIPDRNMLYRTVYHVEGNLGATKPIYKWRSAFYNDVSLKSKTPNQAAKQIPRNDTAALTDWLMKSTVKMDRNSIVAAEHGFDGNNNLITEEHPMEPFGFSRLDSRIYWLEYSDFMRWPGITYFRHIQALFMKLLELDVPDVTSKMKLYNDRTFAAAVSFYRRSFFDLAQGKFAKMDAQRKG